MSGEQFFMLVILAIVVTAVVLIFLSKNRHRIKYVVSNWLKSGSSVEQDNTRQTEQPLTASDAHELTPKESEAELQRLRGLIEDQKQIAQNTDISHHLWSLYKSLVEHTDPKSPLHFNQGGEWYDVKVLRSSIENGLKKYQFELKGTTYTFADDEEQHAWRVNLKLFSLFLYDDSGRCLIEIPMKTTVDGLDRKYLFASGGPRAFLSGSWINDFIYVNLKHQRMRNQEIRAQKHQERLFEIEELKDRFGISD